MSAGQWVAAVGIGVVAGVLGLALFAACWARRPGRRSAREDLELLGYAAAILGRTVGRDQFPELADAYRVWHARYLERITS